MLTECLAYWNIAKGKFFLWHTFTHLELNTVATWVRQSKSYLTEKYFCIFCPTAVEDYNPKDKILFTLTDPHNFYAPQIQKPKFHIPLQAHCFASVTNSSEKY